MARRRKSRSKRRSLNGLDLSDSKTQILLVGALGGGAYLLMKSKSAQAQTAGGGTYLPVPSLPSTAPGSPSSGGSASPSTSVNTDALLNQGVAAVVPALTAAGISVTSAGAVTHPIPGQDKCVGFSGLTLQTSAGPVNIAAFPDASSVQACAATVGSVWQTGNGQQYGRFLCWNPPAAAQSALQVLSSI